MRSILKGATDVSVVIRIVDSADGTPETGVVAATSGLDLRYRREGAATVTLTESDLSALTDAHADGGLLHIFSGYYRVDVPDAAFASGVDGVWIGGNCTGMVIVACYLPLVDFALTGQSAIDLKDFADAGYDPATNKVEGVKLADSLTALAADAITATAIQNDAITAAKIASGAIDADAIADNAIDAGAIAADAITAAKIADGAIDAATFAASAITATAIAADAITAAKIADGAIDAATFAAGAINAAAIAADAITAAKLAADVTTEIQAGLATAAALAVVDGIVDDILADTADMQPKLGTPAGASISADIAAIEAQTDDIGVAGAGLTALASQVSVDDLPTNAELATALGTADDAVLAQVALVKAKTDALPSDPADQSAVEAAITSATSPLATAANLATVAGFLDTEMAATLAAVLNLIGAGYTRTGTAQAGAGTTVTLDAGASAVDDLYNNQLVVIASGTGAGQARFISDYVGATKVATVPTWATNPDSSSVFYTLPFGAIPGATAPTAVEIRQEVDNNSTQLAAIKAKTDNLPTDPADQSLIIVATDAVMARLGAPSGASVSADLADVEGKVDDLESRLGTPSNLGSGATVAANLADIEAQTDDIGAAGAGLTALATAASLATVQTSVDDVPTNAELATALAAADDAVLVQVALVKVKTDGLPSDPADASVVAGLIAAVEAKVDTIDDLIDTEVAAIKAKTDALPADPADASDLAAAFGTVSATLATISGFLDTEIAAIKVVTDQLTAAQAEPVAVPAANATPLVKIAFLAACARNRITQTATTQTLMADDGVTPIAASTHSDDGATHVRGEFV